MFGKKKLKEKSDETAILVEEYKDAPPDVQARITELETLISEARALAAERAEMMSKSGLSPFESPFETVKREHVTKTRDLNRRLVEHASVSRESRIVSQFEDTPPTPRDDAPYGIWNLGYRLEDLALAVSNIILNDFDNGIFDHDHDEYVTKDELEDLIPEVPEIDLDGYATIEYSDGKDAGLALRIESLEDLTTGNEADLGGAAWTLDSDERESHFTTRKDEPNSDEFMPDVRAFRQWLLISKMPASGGDTDQWPIGNQHPSTLTVRSYEGWTATYSCGEQRNMTDRWEIDCYFQSTDAPDGQEWQPGNRYEIKMQAQDTTLDETYASIGHDHGDTETAAQVEQNKKDIQLLKSAMADKMEIVQIEMGNWEYAGENVGSPRQGKFSTDDWYFNKVTKINISKKAVKREVRGGWTEVEVGDEVTITYNDDQNQPWDERYNGRFLITSIIDKSGDNLIANVDFVDGFGTIRDPKIYQIKIRGTRVQDHGSKIEDQQKQIDDLIERLDTMATDEVAASYGHRFKQDSGYFQYAGFQKIQDGRFCWDGKRGEIYISAKDMYGASWRRMTHSDKSVGTQIGTIYEIGDSSEPVKFVTQFNFELLNASSYVVTIKNVNIIFNTGSSNLGNKDYIINLGGVM